MTTSNLLLITPWSYTKDSVKFYLASEIIKYEGVCSELASSIAEICNGKKNFDKVLDELSERNWERSDLEKLIKSMIAQGVIVDATYVHPYFRTFMDNPHPFIPIISDEKIKELMAAGEKDGKEYYKKYPVLNSKIHHAAQLRASTREFGKQNIPKTDLMKILWSLYGKYSTEENNKTLSFRRTVPSGGALYPLNFYLVLFRECGDIDKGIYDVRLQEDSVNLRLKEGNPEVALKSFTDPYMMNNAQGVVIVSAELNRVARKYGNRTTKYCYLEAGHSIQNMLLESSLNGVATCELGGFYEKEVENFLDIKDQEAITAVVFGSFPEEKDDFGKDTIRVGWKSGSQYKIETEIVFGKLSSKKNSRSMSSGKDKKISVALEKLASEVIEWNSWNSLPVVKARGKCNPPIFNRKEK